MTLQFDHTEGSYGSHNDNEIIPFEQMGNFAENAQDRCAVTLVVDVSGSMFTQIKSLNSAIQKFRQTVLSDPVATLRVEAALIAFDSTVDVRQSFCSIEEFNPGPLAASGGTFLCPAVDNAIQMIEERKAMYRSNGIGYYRPWLFILTDGMTGDPQAIPDCARRLREIEAANGVTTFAILAGEARHNGAREQLKKFTDRVLPMKDASYEELLEWMANSTVAMSNSGTGERIKMEDPSSWLEVET